MFEARADELMVGDRFKYVGHNYSVKSIEIENGIVSVVYAKGEFPMEFYLDSIVDVVSRPVLPAL